MHDDASTCTRVRESISARLDGESPAMADDHVSTHLASCHECGAFRAAATGLHRSLRLTAVPPVPDLQARIVAALPDPDAAARRRARRHAQGRVVLGLAGAVQALLAIVVLVGPTDLHVAREVAAFEVSIGTAMLLAAVRPRRFAAGVLPVLAVVAAIVAAAAVADVANGLSTLVGEVPHLLPAIGALVLWRAVPTDGRDLGRAVRT